MCCLDLLRSPRAGQCNGTTMETNGTQRRQQATNNNVCDARAALGTVKHPGNPGNPAFSWEPRPCWDEREEVSPCSHHHTISMLWCNLTVRHAVHVPCSNHHTISMLWCTLTVATACTVRAQCVRGACPVPALCVRRACTVTAACVDVRYGCGPAGSWSGMGAGRPDHGPVWVRAGRTDGRTVTELLWGKGGVAEGAAMAVAELRWPQGDVVGVPAMGATELRWAQGDVAGAPAMAVTEL
eukprot:gene23360-biopygen16350